MERQIELHRSHPAIQQWYRRIHVFECPMPDVGYFCFVGAVFQHELHGNVVWSDGPQTWGLSGWLPLSRDDTFERKLMQLPPAAHGRTFAEILDMIAATQGNIFATRKPWWRFW